MLLLQEVAHGDHNIIQLAEAACPQPPPRAQQFCNVIDCPPAWQAEPWTKVWIELQTSHIHGKGAFAIKNLETLC